MTEQKEKIPIKVLHNLSLFSNLSDRQIGRITSICKVVKFKKNEIIFREEDPYRGFFIVMKGMIKIYKISLEGKAIILHLIKPFESFGDVPLFEGGNYPVHSEAISEAELIFVPKKEFIRLIKNNSVIAFNMLAGFSKKMRMLTQKVEELSTKEVTNRFARFLLTEIKKTGTESLPEPFVRISISKKDIAAYIGTIIDTLSRLLKKLQTEKIIRVSGKTIFILDMKRLKSLTK